MAVPKHIKELPKEKVQKYYEGTLVSVLESINIAGEKIAGKAGEVFLREAGYALSDVGFKNLPRFDKLQDAGKFLEDLWKKIKVIGELKVKSIEDKGEWKEMIIGFKDSNCSITVENKKLERGKCPLCRYSFYFMERTISRLLSKQVEVSFAEFDPKTKFCYERVKVFR